MRPETCGASVFRRRRPKHPHPRIDDLLRRLDRSGLAVHIVDECVWQEDRIVIVVVRRIDCRRFNVIRHLFGRSSVSGVMIVMRGVMLVMTNVAVQVEMGALSMIFRFGDVRADVRMWQHQHLAAEQRENQKYGHRRSQHNRLIDSFIFLL